MAKVLDKVLKYKYSIRGKQLNNWLQLEMGFKPCLQRLTDLEEITVGILTEGSRCDSQTRDSWEMRQGQEKKEWSVSQIDFEERKTHLIPLRLNQLYTYWRLLFFTCCQTCLYFGLIRTI